MPTERARYMLTATPDVERALASASERWPAERDRPSRLLLRLIERGEQAIVDDRAAAVERRRRAIRDGAGSLTGSYEPGYLAKLREDWPE